jgi:hypothetical protein
MLTSLAELVVINLTLSYFSRLLFSVVDEFSADAFIFKLLEISYMSHLCVFLFKGKGYNGNLLVRRKTRYGGGQ